MIPTFITGIVAGMTAALGAHIGAPGSEKATGGSADPKAEIAGAGFGGSLGGVPFLIYLSWW